MDPPSLIARKTRLFHNRRFVGIIACLAFAACMGIVGCAVIITDSIDISTPETGISIGGQLADGPWSDSISGDTEENIETASAINTSLTLSVTLPGQDPLSNAEGLTITVAKGDRVTVSVDRECDTYSWSFNDEDRDTGESEIEIDTKDLEEATYQLSFHGEIDGSPYSKSLKLEVQQRL